MPCSTNTSVFTKSISLVSVFTKETSLVSVFTKEIENESVFCVDSTTIEFGIGTWAIGSSFRIL